MWMTLASGIISCIPLSIPRPALKTGTKQTRSETLFCVVLQIGVSISTFFMFKLVVASKHSKTQRSETNFLNWDGLVVLSLNFRSKPKHESTSDFKKEQQDFPFSNPLSSSTYLGEFVLDERVSRAVKDWEVA